MQKPLQYILITPARNEAQFLEKTITSVVGQTRRPLRWVIVSDGSTDGTDQIVRKYAAENPWLELIRMPERKERHFAGKAHAFDAGYARVKHLDHDVIGNLDADVSFVADHFEFLLGKMAENAKLGVVGAPYQEPAGQEDYRFANVENVWGGCQLFRRKCFEDIGGYVPNRGGSIDHIAVVSARMKGWQTRTFTERLCLHYRQMGTAQQGEVMAKFRTGIKDYSVGNHPVWELLRTVFQTTHKPFVIGGVALGLGYAWSMLRGAELAVSRDFVIFVRREQMKRLARIFARSILGHSL